MIAVSNIVAVGVKCVSHRNGGCTAYEMPQFPKQTCSGHIRFRKLRGAKTIG